MMELAKTLGTAHFKRFPEELSFFLKTLGLGTFNGMYDAHHLLNPSPLLSHNFGKDEWTVLFEYIHYESKH